MDAQDELRANSLKATTDRIAEGHTETCEWYERPCDCGYNEAITNALDAAARFEKWLDEITQTTIHKMETNEHAEDRHDRETMLRTLNLVRLIWEGSA